MSTGADLERLSLAEIDALESKINALGKTTAAVLATAMEREINQLRRSLGKVISSDGERNRFTSSQLSSRIQNSLQKAWREGLLTPAEQTRLTRLYTQTLSEAWDLGNKEGVSLGDLVKTPKDGAVKDNAKVNRPAIENAGRRLNSFWDFESQQFKQRVTALVQVAVAEGKSWRSLALQIRELLRNDKTQSAEGQRRTRRMGVNGRAELIARTEIQTAYINGKVERFKKRGITWARWSAAAERSCPFCISRDGLVFELQDVETDIPAHPRCRCTLVPADPPPGWTDKGADKNALAAEHLDDAFWSKARADKLNRWKKEQRDKGNNKDLNKLLRQHLNTPTNQRRNLLGTDKAPKPAWMPSGKFNPDSRRVADGAARAQEQAKQAAEAERLRQEQEAAAAQAREEQEQARREAEEQARIAKEKWKAEQEEIARAKAEVDRLKAELAAAKAQAKQQAAQKQPTAGINAANHVVNGAKKATTDHKMVQEAFDNLRKMEGLSGENFRKLERFIEKHQIAIIFSPASANTPTLKGQARILQEMDAMFNNPILRQATENAIKWHRHDDPTTAATGSRLKAKLLSPDNRLAADGFLPDKRANGFTITGGGHVSIGDWKGHKPINKAVLSQIREELAAEFDNAAKGAPPEISQISSLYRAIDQVRSGKAKKTDVIGGQNQTSDNWINTLIHELGHQVHFRGGHRNGKGKTVTDKTHPIDQMMDVDLFMPTAYGGSNIWEQFAENFVHFIYNPQKLKQTSPDTYFWIEEHLENALSRNDVPPPS